MCTRQVHNNRNVVPIHTFTRCDGQLAREASRTPPLAENSPFEYLDQSLTVIGHSTAMPKEYARSLLVSVNISHAKEQG